MRHDIIFLRHSSVYRFVYIVSYQHLYGFALAHDYRVTWWNDVCPLWVSFIHGCYGIVTKMVRTHFPFLTSSTTYTSLGSVSVSPFQRRNRNNAFFIMLLSSVCILTMATARHSTKQAPVIFINKPIDLPNTCNMTRTKQYKGSNKEAIIFKVYCLTNTCDMSHTKQQKE